MVRQRSQLDFIFGKESFQYSSAISSEGHSSSAPTFGTSIFMAKPVIMVDGKLFQGVSTGDRIGLDRKKVGDEEPGV